MRLAILHTTLRYVRSFGYFQVRPTLQPFEEMVQLDQAAKPLTEPLHHQTVLGGQFYLLSLSDIPAVEADVEDRKDATASGALTVRLVRASAGLPVPPPDKGLMVLVMDTGGGVAGLAVSDATGWNIIPADPRLRVS